MERSTAWANLLSERVEKIINILDPLEIADSAAG